MTFDEWMVRAIGVPFVPTGRDFDGWDCWGLVIAAYRDVAGIGIPDYTCGISDFKRLAGLFKDRAGGQWRQVEEPEPMTVACIYRRGSVIHAGLLAPRRRIIHVEEGIATCTQPLTDFRVEGFYVPCVS